MSICWINPTECENVHAHLREKIQEPYFLRKAEMEICCKGLAVDLAAAGQARRRASSSIGGSMMGPEFGPASTISASSSLSESDAAEEHTESAWDIGYGT